jgi:hypothetical protein
MRCHDPLVMARYRAPDERLAGIACGLDGEHIG